MSLEANAAQIIGGAFIDAAGGSIVLFGIIALIGIALLMKKLEMGLSSGIMIVMMIFGYLYTSNMDSRFILGNEIGPAIPFFKLLYLLLVIGVAVYWAIFLRRR